MIRFENDFVNLVNEQFENYTGLHYACRKGWTKAV